MGRRGRPPNVLRQAARDAGDTIYRDAGNPCWCGCADRYTSNAQCVTCMIERGKNRYAALEGDALARQKVEDHRRYAARRARQAAAVEAKARLNEATAPVDDADFL